MRFWPVTQPCKTHERPLSLGLQFCVHCQKMEYATIFFNDNQTDSVTPQGYQKVTVEPVKPKLHESEQSAVKDCSEKHVPRRRLDFTSRTQWVASLVSRPGHLRLLSLESLEIESIHKLDAKIEVAESSNRGRISCFQP